MIISINSVLLFFSLLILLKYKAVFTVLFCTVFSVYFSLIIVTAYLFG